MLTIRALLSTSLFLLAGCSSTPASQNQPMSKFTACKLYVLAANCNLGRDQQAPAYLRQGGPASCFAGLDTAITEDGQARGRLFFDTVIAEEQYSRSHYEAEIDQISGCLDDVEALRNCDLGFVASGGMQSVTYCN